MEDLYNNLENYNEVNALEELRSENKEMKVKLEQYATAMEKLQKNILQEFDTLSSEFRKLELNYSSLLKTAKAEIERKTKIITDINIEKDMLVLSALQNSNKNIRETKNGVPDIKQTHKKSLHKKGVKNTKAVIEKKNSTCESIKENLQENQARPDEKVNKKSKENTQQGTPVDNHEKKDIFNEGKISVKENTKHEQNAKSVSPTAMNLKNRRKSIPHTDVGSEKFSSDEMSDWPPGTSKNDIYMRHREDRKYSGKDNYVSKISEDDKIFEPSREILKGRAKKHFNGDKHRKRDKFDKPKRYKTHYSPDRYNRRVSRDYYDDYHRRPEFSRSRGRESPIDRVYHKSYKDYQQHEKYHLNEQERFSYGPDRNTGKHKILHEYDEPNRKRQKTESYSRLKDSGKYDRESYKDQELAETFEKLQEQYTSCQSPDYIGCDATTPEPIKEIMNTAEIPLEDPRLASHKYILNNDKSSAGFTTANSSHVDLIPVDKAKWGMKKISMPDALIQLPPQEQFIKDFNPDIIENLSIESGEVVDNLQNGSNEHFERNIIMENKCSNQSNNICVSQNISEKENCITVLDGYKIPKMKKCEEEINKKDREQSLDKIENLYINQNKNGKQKIVQQRSKSLCYNHDTSAKYNALSDNKIQEFGENNNNVLETERFFSTREIVEGDLELSDETCDTIEFQKTSIQNPGTEDSDDFHKSKTHPNIDNTSKKPSNHDIKENIRLDLKLDPSFAKKSLHNDNNVPQNKKQSMQKKAHTYKESDHIEINDKNVNTSRDKKEKPKMVKTKFTELFGDSSSLITPDDLGISPSQVPSPSELTANYVPIFEDAVDATDLQPNTNIKIATIPDIKEDERKSSGRNGKVNILDTISKNHRDTKDIHKLENHDKKVIKEPTSVIDPLRQDLNFTSLKKSDIVATVIISTGVQPDVINSVSRAESLVNAEELLTDNVEQDEINDTHRQQDLLLKALATSTPHKEIVTQIGNEIHSKPSDAAHDSNGRLPNIDMASETTKSLHLDSNTSNTLEPLNEDLPDVRIFVKRRRRIGKIVK